MSAIEERQDFVVQSLGGKDERDILLKKLAIRRGFMVETDALAHLPFGNDGGLIRADTEMVHEDTLTQLARELHEGGKAAHDRRFVC
jgi:hypothetical protein